METSQKESQDPYFFVSDVLEGVSEADRSRLVLFVNYLEDWILIHGNGEFTDFLLRRFKFHDLYRTFMAKEGFEVSLPIKDNSELIAYWYLNALLVYHQTDL